MNLNLQRPLIYAKSEINIAKIPEIQENEEILFCYSLNPRQSRSIEPVLEELLGNLMFAGHKIGENINTNAKTVSLPQGKYLFAQQRSAQALDQSQWLEMAIEQQKDGLWERNKLGDLLYVRYLFEDSACVTQVFREVTVTYATSSVAI